MEKFKLNNITSLVKLSVREAIELYDKGILSVNLIVDGVDIQRNFVWSAKKSFYFIESLLDQKNGIVIPSLIGVEQNGSIQLADGHQRFMSIIKLVQNNLRFPKKAMLEGKDVSQLKFSKLSEKVQEEILNATFSIQVTEYISDKQKKEIFIRLNSGEGLKNIESTRPFLAPQLRELESITETKFFKEILKIRNKNFADLNLALGFVIEQHFPNHDQNPASRKFFAEETLESTKINTAFLNKMNVKLDYLYDLFHENNIGKGNLTATKKTILKNSNYIILYKMAGYFVQEDINVDVAWAFLNWYFVDNGFDYIKVAGTTSTNNKPSIEKRHEHIVNEFKKFAKLSKKGKRI
ncbi:MAG: hypothetical protein K0R54_606 [Clostridiaceae bacterium]|jgi:hypothetical protein|nr:hypothetical protein [Clostridiaceae bacterium]